MECFFFFFTFISSANIIAIFEATNYRILSFDVICQGSLRTLKSAQIKCIILIIITTISPSLFIVFIPWFLHENHKAAVGHLLVLFTPHPPPSGRSESPTSPESPHFPFNVSRNLSPLKFTLGAIRTPKPLSGLFSLPSSHILTACRLI